MNNISVQYTIHNDALTRRDRSCQSILTPDEQNTFLRAGVVVPTRRMDSRLVNQLRNTVDRLCADRSPTTGDPEFAGQYLRDPHTQDPGIITAALLEFPLADTARCLLGPRIRLRNSNIRRTLPTSGDATIWHTDYRPHTTPPPPLPAAPIVITMLLYLDPANDETGPLLVVPGSHAPTSQPPRTHEDQPGQQTLRLEPGQVVVMDAAMWHRAGPNRSHDQVRRLVTLQLCSVYMSAYNFEPGMPSPAYQRLVERAKAHQDEPLLELVGLGGLSPSSAGY